MKALLVIDMQTGVFAGLPPRHDAEGTVTRINALARAVRPEGLVVFIQHTDAAEGLARHTPAWALLPALDHQAQDLAIEKTACDAFLETPLHALLLSHGVTEVIVTGCATDFCVDTTVRAAASHGYAVTVPADAHTTRDRPHLSAAAIITHHHFMWADLLLPRGARVRVPGTADLLNEWRR